MTLYFLLYYFVIISSLIFTSTLISTFVFTLLKRENNSKYSSIWSSLKEANLLRVYSLIVIVISTFIIMIPVSTLDKFLGPVVGDSTILLIIMLILIFYLIIVGFFVNLSVCIFIGIFLSVKIVGIPKSMIFINYK